MKLKKFVHYGASLMLALVLLGVFAPNVVLSQSTNADIAALVVVEPELIVPEKIPVTSAEALVSSESILYGFQVVIRTEQGSRVELLVPRTLKLGVEENLRLVAQDAANSEILDPALTHYISVAGRDYWRVTSQFSSPPLEYRHDGKPGFVKASEVGSKLRFIWEPSVENYIEFPMPSLTAAGIHGTNIASGATVNMIAGQVGGTNRAFFVAPAAGLASHVAIPLGLDKIFGELVLTNRFFEVHHFKLPSGRFVETTVDRSLTITPVANEPGKVLISIRGKVGDTVLVFSGTSLDQVLGASPYNQPVQVFPDKHLFIPPKGVLGIKLPVNPYDGPSLFKAVHYTSQEEAQRSLKR